ncbi:unnamed protein product, partial [Meganyctiphanes norvegica]
MILHFATLNDIFHFVAQFVGSVFNIFTSPRELQILVTPTVARCKKLVNNINFACRTKKQDSIIVAEQQQDSGRGVELEEGVSSVIRSMRLSDSNIHMSTEIVVILVQNESVYKNICCTARINLREVVSFPDYELVELNEITKSACIKDLLRNITTGNVRAERRVYVVFPTAAEHSIQPLQDDDDDDIPLNIEEGIHMENQEHDSDIGNRIILSEVQIDQDQPIKVAVNFPVTINDSTKRTPKKVPYTPVERSSTPHCLVCNVTIRVPASAILDIFSEKAVTSHRQLQLDNYLGTLTHLTLTRQSVHSTIICRRCFQLIDDLDQLEEEVDNKKQQVVSRFQRTQEALQDVQKSSVNNSNVCRKTTGAIQSNDKDYLPFQSSGRGRAYNRGRGRPPGSRGRGRPPNVDTFGVQTSVVGKPRGRGRPRGRPPLTLTRFRNDKISFLQNKSSSSDNIGNIEQDIKEDVNNTSEVMQKEKKENEVSSKFFSNVKIERPVTPIATITASLNPRVKVETVSISTEDKGSMEAIIKNTSKDMIKTVSTTTTTPEGITVTAGRIKNSQGSIENLITASFETSAEEEFHSVDDDDDDHMNGEITIELREDDDIETIGEEKLLTCPTCPNKTKFRSKVALKNHLKLHRTQDDFVSHVCDICGKCFSTKYNLRNHRKLHGVRSRAFSCDSCEKSFYSRHHLSSHIASVHEGKQAFACVVCGKHLSTLKTLEIHTLTHTGEKPYQCEICGSQFRQRSNLQTHIRSTHWQEKRYRCDACGKAFTRKRLLTYHINSVHLQQRPYKCDLCNATFVYPHYYKRHLRKHTGEKPYKCTTCGKNFNSRENCNAHMFTHTDMKPYECKLCGAGFMRKPLLFSHIQSHHGQSENVMQFMLFNSLKGIKTEEKELEDLGLSEPSVEIIATDLDTMEVVESIGTDVRLSEGMKLADGIRLEEGVSLADDEEGATASIQVAGVAGEPLEGKVVKVLPRQGYIIQASDNTRYIIHTTPDTPIEGVSNLFAQLQGHVVEVSTHDC